MEILIFLNIAEIKCIRRTAGYTWTDHKTNTDITNKLNITPFGLNTGLQEKMDKICKLNAM
jgi:hypothetical protein